MHVAFLVIVMPGKQPFGFALIDSDRGAATVGHSGYFAIRGDNVALKDGPFLIGNRRHIPQMVAHQDVVLDLRAGLAC